jgi:hypothetical protein
MSIFEKRRPHTPLLHSPVRVSTEGTLTLDIGVEETFRRVVIVLMDRCDLL